MYAGAQEISTDIRLNPQTEPLRLKKMRVLELFAGYGSQALALENLGIDFISDISEIDKYAIQAYNQLHGDTHNWGDITKIDETKLPYYDLITYSSPCQDFSVAGLGKGGDAGSGTRSSLLWECERIIRAVKPKYLLMENVKNLVGKKHKHNFIRWLQVLEMMGYQNYWQVLNAKDYGVPQNRERVFVVSILGCGQYLFPNPIKLEKRLKDVLEPVVDEKYYLSSKIIEGFLKRTEQQKQIKGGYIFQPSTGDCVSKTLTGCNNYRITDNYICVGGMQKHQSITTDGVSTCLCSSMGQGGGYVPMIIASRKRENRQELELNETGCSNTLTSVQKDNYVVVPEATKQGYAKAYDGDSINLDQPNSKTRRGRVGKQMSNTLTTSCNIGVVQVGNIIETDSFGGNPERGRVYDDKGISPCLSTMQGGGLEPKIVEERFFEQAIETAIENNAQNGDIIDAYNKNINNNGISPTLTTRPEGFKTAILPVQNYRIRKLTPRECWRLMGVKDEQFNKLHGISNSQLYKLAGNSIVVDVLMGIFKNLFLKNESTGQLSLFGGNK